ncbi:SDR family NAD(P)-dependent oxidoreductase [Pararobbsia alpina]|nr:SDR family oxidoreductase [Pararobbsia alpina]
MSASLALAGKVAAVTGAAGGLGGAICHRLAAAGATVVAGYNRSERSAALMVEQLPSPQGARHFALAMPVTDSAALRDAASTILKRSSRLDILVNCAGTTRFVRHDDLDSLDDPLIDEILTTNVRGPFATIRAFRHALAASDDGLVVNVSSIAAQTAMGSNVIYCASKAAVDNMTRSLARALAPRIRVVSIAPGLVDTEFVKSMDVDWRNGQAAKTPLGRLAYPTEIADGVIAAATLLRFSTGTVIAVDGGRPLL